MACHYSEKFFTHFVFFSHPFVASNSKIEIASTHAVERSSFQPNLAQTSKRAGSISFFAYFCPCIK